MDHQQYRVCTQQLWSKARGALHMYREGSAPSGLSRKAENGPVRDPAPSCIHEEFHGQRTYLTYKSSSPGMEFLLKRTTISYSHCGLTSTSWKKKLSFTSPGWAATTEEQKHAAALQIQKFHLQAVKAVLRVHSLVGKFLLSATEWLGRKFIRTNLLE